MKYTNNNQWALTVFFIVHYLTLLSLIIYPVQISIQQRNYWWLLLWLFIGLLPKMNTNQN